MGIENSSLTVLNRDEDIVEHSHENWKQDKDVQYLFLLFYVFLEVLATEIR